MQILKKGMRMFSYIGTKPAPVQAHIDTSWHAKIHHDNMLTLVEERTCTDTQHVHVHLKICIHSVCICMVACRHSFTDSHICTHTPHTRGIMHHTHDKAPIIHIRQSAHVSRTRHTHRHELSRVTRAHMHTSTQTCTLTCTHVFIDTHAHTHTCTSTYRQAARQKEGTSERKAQRG